MKKLTIILIAAILFAVVSKSFAQWTNTILHGGGPINVEFIDQQNGFSVGDNGCVLRTSDKGKTWIIRSILTNNNLKSVSALTEENFWVCGANGTIFKTTDGGASWIDQSVNTTETLISIFFTDNNNGHVVGANGLILKTINGGSSWTSQTITGISWFNDVFFINAQVGWAIGSNKILKTVDGGETWAIILSLYQSIYCVQFINENLGYFGGIGIFKTTDGGSSLNVVANVGNIFSINFIDHENGWAVGDYNKILKTTNSGNDWENCAPDPNLVGGGSQYLSVYFTDKDHGYVCPGMFQTSDGGQTWRKQVLGMPHFWGTFAIDPNICWAVGGAGIFMTKDGGSTWAVTTPEEWPLNSSPDLYDVYFINSSIGWVCGGNGHIFKTTNGGVDWHVQSSYEHRLLRTIFFIDSNNGWAAGTDISYNDAFLKTTNGGSTWIDTDMGTIDDFSSIYFVNSNVGWLASNLRLYKTTNGGNDWTANPANITSTNSIRFIDENNGWAAGLKIYKTTDGGFSWNEIIRPSAYGVKSFHFYDEFNGWAGGFEGLYYTNDGGISWSKQDNARIESISLTDQYHGWAVGLTDGFYGYNTSAILKTINGGGTAGEPEQRVVIDEKFDGVVFPPEDWTVIQNHSTNTWAAGNVENQNFNMIDQSNVNSAICPWVAENQNEWLVTPEFTLAEGNASIEFYAGYSTLWLTSATLKLLISINGGTNWTEIWEAVNDGQSWGWRSQKVDITQYASNSSMKLAWQYIGKDGDIAAIDNVKLTGFVTVTDLQRNDAKQIPSNYKLSQNYPNPFNPITKINYVIPYNGYVQLTVYDILGRTVKTLVDQIQNAGSYSIDFDGQKLSSGVYFYRLNSGRFSETRKLILLR